MTTLYVATENSDLTEGRGHTIVTGLYIDPEEAVKAVHKRGTMGVGDGDVYTIELTDGKWKGRNLFQNKYYGYRQRNGVWGYGYASDKDDDPEYIEYLRLKQKYGRM